MGVGCCDSLAPQAKLGSLPLSGNSRLHILQLTSPCVATPSTVDLPVLLSNTGLQLAAWPHTTVMVDAYNVTPKVRASKIQLIRPEAMKASQGHTNDLDPDAVMTPRFRGWTSTTLT